MAILAAVFLGAMCQNAWVESTVFAGTVLADIASAIYYAAALYMVVSVTLNELFYQWTDPLEIDEEGLRVATYSPLVGKIDTHLAWQDIGMIALYEPRKTLLVKDSDNRAILIRGASGWSYTGLEGFDEAKQRISTESGVDIRTVEDKKRWKSMRPSRLF